MTYEGNCHLGDLFKSRREKGRPGVPVLSVTMNDGLVDREDLERKQDTNLLPSEHLLVKQGDFAYNMMRMWQGASGLAVKEGMVSPAYIVLAPTEGAATKVDLRYMAYLFKSRRVVYLFWAYSYGLTSDRLRLYFDDFAKIPVFLPGLSEQKEIAEILSATDRAIEVLNELIDNSLTSKRALIQQLISGTKRLPGFSRRVRKQEFSNFCDRVKEKINPIFADNKLRCIELENIDSLTGRLLGSTNIEDQSSAKCVFSTEDVLFGKLRPYLKKYWLADSEGYCSTEIWVLRANGKKCLPAYLHLICQSERFSKACHAVAGSKMPRAEWSFVSVAPFMLPSLDEQQAIVDFISTIASEIECLTKKREILCKQKQWLMQHLFSSKRSGQILNAASA